MVKIRNLNSSDLHVAALLVKDTYKVFNQNEGSKQAVQDYINFYDPSINYESIRKRFKRTPIKFVAIDELAIVGMIRGFEDRLINLFVDGRYHRKGIAFKLLSKFERACESKGSKEIKTRASIYAIPFYEANGYKKTTGIRNLDGLKVQPMKKQMKS